MTTLSFNHMEQLCYYCNNPIYGEGIIDHPPNKPSTWGNTTFHPDCYRKAWENTLEVCHIHKDSTQKRLEMVFDYYVKRGEKIQELNNIIYYICGFVSQDNININALIEKYPDLAEYLK